MGYKSTYKNIFSPLAHFAEMATNQLKDRLTSGALCRNSPKLRTFNKWRTLCRNGSLGTYHLNRKKY